MRHLLPIVLVTACGLVSCNDGGSSSCTSDCVSVNGGGPVIQGSGKIETQTRQVGVFTAIRSSASTTIMIQGTGQAVVSVTADDNLLPMIVTEVRDGVLQVGFANGKSFAGKMPVVRINVADLRGIDLAGSGAVRASAIDVAKLSVAESGSGEIHLDGKAGELAARIAGSGSLDAADLAAKRATVVVSGSGEATVNASDELDATVSGSGSIRYRGSPKLASHVTGSGSVTHK